uniref:ChaB family protein n=1 Tax=Cyanothece sp. (strain PCC 7425 / ATCC 29141) TaxID=395961 RepID=B8HUR4_CYAP4
MPFEKLEDLPQDVQQLPSEGQQIFRVAFNSACEDGMSEEGALQVAWNSVKSEYAQGEDGQWQFKKDLTTADNRSKAVQSGGN